MVRREGAGSPHPLRCSRVPVAAGAACGTMNGLFWDDGYPNLLKMLEFGGKKEHHLADGGAAERLFEASTPNSPRAGGRGPQQGSGQGVTEGPKKIGGETVKTAPQTPRGQPGTNLRKSAPKGAWMTPIPARLWQRVNFNNFPGTLRCLGVPKVPRFHGWWCRFCSFPPKTPPLHRNAVKNAHFQQDVEALTLSLGHFRRKTLKFPPFHLKSVRFAAFWGHFRSFSLQLCTFSAPFCAFSAPFWASSMLFLCLFHLFLFVASLGADLHLFHPIFAVFLQRLPVPLCTFFFVPFSPRLQRSFRLQSSPKRRFCHSRTQNYQKFARLPEKPIVNA